MTTPRTLEYKGYTGSVNVNIEDGILFGKIECINDLVMYDAITVPDINTAFIEAVDDYLATCDELGREPNKVFSGSFNTRVGTERHKNLYLEKLKTDKSSINEVLCMIIDGYFNKSSEVHNHKHIHVHRNVAPEQPSIAISDWSGNEPSAPMLQIVK